jgi:NAD(P)-dependent dehydrogenase (short-subunit alcohol dehydrogenase family)
VALVTGGARRIGRAIVECLAQAGATPVIHHLRSASEAEDLVCALAAQGVQAHAVRADLHVPAEVETLLGRAEALAGPVDILVNSASLFPPGDLASLTLAALQENLQVNAFAPLFLARALAARGRPGHVVNLLDTRVVRHDRHHVAYQLSKQLLHQLTLTLALELAPAVAVNAVAPGPALPPEGEGDAYLERLARTTPLQRAGGVEEVAAAVRFLVQSTMITGQVLFVDGGGHLRGGFHG